VLALGTGRRDLEVFGELVPLDEEGTERFIARIERGGSAKARRRNALSSPDVNCEIGSARARAVISFYGI
jgi:hypothetical protein